jgi:hypothetical protein
VGLGAGTGRIRGREVWRQEDGIGGVDSWPAVLRMGAAKRIGVRAAGVVGRVGDGLRHVRIEADDGAGWPVQNWTAKWLWRTLPSGVKGSSVSPKKERAGCVQNQGCRCVRRMLQVSAFPRPALGGVATAKGFASWSGKVAQVVGKSVSP